MRSTPIGLALVGESITFEPFLRGIALLNAILAEIVRAAKEAPALYFAPLIGAVRGIRQQYRLLEHKRRRSFGSRRTF